MHCGVDLGVIGVRVFRQVGLVDHLNVNERGASLCEGFGGSLLNVNMIHSCGGRIHMSCHYLESL